MFNEENTVEALIRDLLTTRVISDAKAIHEDKSPYGTDNTANAIPSVGTGWSFIAGRELPRATNDVVITQQLRTALIALNPSIAARPEYAADVIHRLRAILLTVRDDGLVKANEEFTAWLRGEKTMPFGQNGDHESVRLIDLKKPHNNKLIVSTQVTYKVGNTECRFDLVLWINGIPLVVGEAKTPTRPAVSWVDGALQIHDDYEKNIPTFFVPNVFSFATEGKAFRYGAIKMPVDLWAPWREDAAPIGTAPIIGESMTDGLREVRKAVRGMLRPEVVLDILANFTLFATDRQHRKIKVICRYQQYDTVNRIVTRVVEGNIKRGLIWHFQGSGKSLLMVFAAQKLRRNPLLKAPTIIIVVDRIELDAQITATFHATDVPNVVAVDKRENLIALLATDTRKTLITTIHKFAESDGVLNTRDNIILLVDEAHRTQEGDLAQRMRQALPNAFFFGLTGTPINKRDHNTFWAFGAIEDQGGYMSRYSFEESIRDKATLPLHFEARLIELRIDKAAINQAFKNISGHLSETDAANLSRQAARMQVLVKAPERIAAITADIARHFSQKVEPNGFKAQVVVFDQESCILYKEALDGVLPPEASTVVISVDSGEREKRLLQYRRTRDDEEKLLDRFRDPRDPLQILIVTAKLLTGFDAPILQTMYLDKPLKEHTLLQAICRTNRPYPDKSHGLIVDYLGVFDDVAQALSFDEAAMRHVITNLEELKKLFPEALATCLAFFPGVDRSIGGYEGLIAAQDCLPNNDTRDSFAKRFSVLTQLWEALSPDLFLAEYADDYRWLGQVYESVKPPSGNGKLVWHALGAKTVELIHDHIYVEQVHDDFETLVLDPDVLASLTLDSSKAKKVEIQIAERLRRHAGDPRFVELGQRLEDLKLRFEQGMMTSLDFLKALLGLASDVLEAERKVEPIEERDRAKTALTELFQEVKTERTPIIVERLVSEIDEIVRQIRFVGWQETFQGEREVKNALRKSLWKYQLHSEKELFDKAYAYIRQYYAM